MKGIKTSLFVPLNTNKDKIQTSKYVNLFKAYFFFTQKHSPEL